MPHLTPLSTYFNTIVFRPSTEMPKDDQLLVYLSLRAVLRNDGPPLWRSQLAEQAFLLQTVTNEFSDGRAMLLHPNVWCGALDFRQKVTSTKVIFGRHTAVLTVGTPNSFHFR